MQLGFNKKNIIIIIVFVLFVIIAGVYFFNSKKSPKQIYEVAVMVRDQNSGLDDDAKISLKKGDCLVVQAEGHDWSRAEKTSYLILRMNLTQEQSQLLLQAKTREIPFDDLSEDQKQMLEEEKKRAEEEGVEYVSELQKETLIAREYRIDMSEFDDFKAVDLLNGQPFENEVYGWGIVERKR